MPILLPSVSAFHAWREIHEETPIFWGLLVDPRNGYSCPYCDHTVLTPVENHRCPDESLAQRLVGVADGPSFSERPNSYPGFWNRELPAVYHG